MHEKQTPAMLTLLQTLRAHSSSLFHNLPLGPKLHELGSASGLYLHASSGCRSTGVHGLDVTGFAASDHKAPAHSIANNLGGKHGVGMQRSQPCALLSD